MQYWCLTSWRVKRNGKEMLSASLKASQQPKLFAARLRECSESPDTPDESDPNSTLKVKRVYAS